jgi:hypothetical protein
MGIQPGILDEYEEGLLQRLPEKLQKYVTTTSAHGSKLDREVRRWFAITMTSILLDWKSKISRPKMESLYAPFFLPPDYSDATVHNCFFLRFIDLAPQFLFRDIKTLAVFKIYESVSIALRAGRGSTNGVNRKSGMRSQTSNAISTSS